MLIVPCLPRNFLGHPRSIQWHVRHRLSALGQRLHGSTTTARKTSQVRRDFLSLRNIKHMVLLSTKPVAGSSQKTQNTLLSRSGFKAGTFKLWGTRDLCFYQLKQIKRVRVVRRADGYYAQFCLDIERVEKREPTKKTIGLDVGLNHFYTDSDGNQVENPRYLRKSEKALKRLSRRLSRTEKGSKNRAKARKKLGCKHLKVSRQRKDFAVKLARCVIQSNDLVAYEDLKVRNLVKNKKLSKSISDAAWSLFRDWLEYFGKVFGVATVAVPPHYTSQNCSRCGSVVKKSLSTRTHRCGKCLLVLDRDWNAAINILELALRTVGHTGTSNASGEIDLCLGEVIPQGKPTRGKRKPKQQCLESSP